MGNNILEQLTPYEYLTDAQLAELKNKSTNLSEEDIKKVEDHQKGMMKLCWEELDKLEL